MLTLHRVRVRSDDEPAYDSDGEERYNDYENEGYHTDSDEERAANNPMNVLMTGYGPNGELLDEDQMQLVYRYDVRLCDQCVHR